MAPNSIEKASSIQSRRPLHEKPVLYYVANTQNENLGDILINLLLIEQCVKLFDVTINVRNCPDHYIEAITKTGCSIVDTNYASFITKIMRSGIRGNRTYFFQKPGHFFGDEGGLKKTMVRTLSFVAMHCSNVRLARVGASIGPFRTKSEILLEKLQASLHALYSVREHYSQKYCQEYGLQTNFCPDMAFLLAVRQQQVVNYDYCLSFRNIHLDDDRSEKAVRSLQSLTQNSRIAVVTQVERDHIFNHNLTKWCKAKVHVSFRGSNADEIFAIYNASATTLSNRLHVLLFAAAYGSIPIPVINRAKQTKIAGIFEDIGLGYLIFDLQGELPLDRHVQTICAREASIRSTISAIYQEKAQQICEILTRLSEDNA